MRIAATILAIASLFFFQRAPGQTSNQDVGDLKAQRQALERQLEARRSAGLQLEDPSLRKIQAQLLAVADQEQEARRRLPETAKSLNSVNTIISIPVFFMTDRVRLQEKYSGDAKEIGMDFGVARTTLGYSTGVRTDRIPGAAILPQDTKISYPVINLMKDQPQFLAELSRKAADPNGRGSRRVLLFVPGYRTSFEEAADTAARIAVSLQFPVIPLVYSWPSEATYSGYWHDEDTVTGSLGPFVNFLKLLLNQHDYDVFIVCHSMGARLITAALSELGRSSANPPALKQVVYAAGDISISSFNKAWPDMQKLTATQFSFYASSSDFALHLSHFLHGFRRIGDASPEVYAPDHADSMDASSIDPFLQGLGHSYLVSSPRIGADISRWIENNDPPLKRDLVEKVGKEGVYYIFP